MTDRLGEFGKASRIDFLEPSCWLWVISYMYYIGLWVDDVWLSHWAHGAIRQFQDQVYDALEQYQAPLREITGSDPGVSGFSWLSGSPKNQVGRAHWFSLEPWNDMYSLYSLYDFFPLSHRQWVLNSQAWSRRWWTTSRWPNLGPKI